MSTVGLLLWPGGPLESYTNSYALDAGGVRAAAGWLRYSVSVLQRTLDLL
jgi:hypothetical protein